MLLSYASKKEVEKIHSRKSCTDKRNYENEQLSLEISQSHLSNSSKKTSPSRNILAKWHTRMKLEVMLRGICHSFVLRCLDSSIYNARGNKDSLQTLSPEADPFMEKESLKGPDTEMSLVSSIAGSLESDWCLSLLVHILPQIIPYTKGHHRLTVQWVPKKPIEWINGIFWNYGI